MTAGNGSPTNPEAVVTEPALQGSDIAGDFKQALRRLAKAVTVVTSAKDGSRAAMSATAVCEVSLDPPSMLVCINRSASLYALLEQGAPFAVNILHYTSIDIATNCGGALSGEARFLHGEWAETELGVPRLTAAQACIVCHTVKTIEHGTHSILIGNVAEVYLDGEPNPLVYLNGAFMRATELESVHG